jgi:NADPH-dependent glutamate synthase beta subunit-like oxidoreductase
VRIEYLLAPVQVTGADRVTGLEGVRMQLGPRDESGRRRPEPIPGSEFTVPADWVIPAAGQAPNLGFAASLGFETSRAGTVVVDENTLQTSRPGVFAAGDAVTGPATVVEAFGAGNRAADAIHRFLRGLPTPPAVPPEKSRVPLDRPRDEDLTLRPRVRMPALEGPKRTRSFEEIEKGLTEEQAVLEAKRCLRCGLR